MTPPAVTPPTVTPPAVTPPVGPIDPATGLPLAVCVVVRHGPRYLMIRRAPGATLPGYWTPVTGRVEPGESLEAAARREVAEEVALDVVVEAELHRCLTSNGAFWMVWFGARLEREPPSDATPPLQLATREVDAARWLTPAEIVALERTFPATRAFFGALAQGR